MRKKREPRHSAKTNINYLLCEMFAFSWVFAFPTTVHSKQAPNRLANRQSWWLKNDVVSAKLVPIRSPFQNFRDQAWIGIPKDMLWNNILICFLSFRTFIVNREKAYSLINRNLVGMKNLPRNFKTKHYKKLSKSCHFERTYSSFFVA